MERIHRRPDGRFNKDMTGMTHFLASVRNRAEAETVLAAGADIVDLKDPGKGALGAVDPGIVVDCLAAVGGRKPVSATVGDLPMAPQIVAGAVAATAGLGVDNVKLGVTSGGDPFACFETLRDLDLRAGLILVFFADEMPRFDPIEAAKACGADGVMLDTAGKGGGALPDHMPLHAIGRFIGRAHDAGLRAGVAGSLRAAHVMPLLGLRPDVIGFRGGLCRGGVRGENLDPEACARIGALIASGRTDADRRFEERSASTMC